MVCVEADDRRAFITSVDGRYAGRQTDQSKEYFDKILAVDYRHFAHFLYQFDLTGFNPRAPPSTSYMRFQKLLNFDSAVAWIEKMLRDSSGMLYNGSELSCVHVKGRLYRQYCSREGTVSYKSTLVEPLFWKVFQRIITLKKGRETTGRRLHTVELPCLADARLQFEGYVKEVGRWDWDIL
jgi:hypothetical protein